MSEPNISQLEKEKNAEGLITILLYQNDARQEAVEALARIASLTATTNCIIARGTAVELLLTIMEKGHPGVSDHPERWSAAEALSKTGNLRALQWLISHIQQPTRRAKQAVLTLIKVLQPKTSRARIPLEELRVLAHITNVSQLTNEGFFDGYELPDSLHQVDCSQLSEFARKELRRRGVSE